MISRHPGGHSQLGVRDQVSPLTVHGHDVAWLDDVVAVEQLPRRRVARDVHPRIALVHDGRSQAHQPVDDAKDRVLIARDE